MIYAAFLRGINGGGKNKVEMKKLKATFESLGFDKVATYINSGNIVFDAGSIPPDQLVGSIEQGIQKKFQLDLKVLVSSFPEMDNILNHLPPTWVKNKEMRTDVMFLWDEIDSPDIVQQIRINAVDTVKYVPGALLWNVIGANYSKSGIMALMGTALYRQMTIRNANTFRKVHQMMTDIGYNE